MEVVFEVFCLENSNTHFPPINPKLILFDNISYFTYILNIEIIPCDFWCKIYWYSTWTLVFWYVLTFSLLKESSAGTPWYSMQMLLEYCYIFVCLSCRDLSSWYSIAAKFCMWIWGPREILSSLWSREQCYFWNPEKKKKKNLWIEQCNLS